MRKILVIIFCILGVIIGIQAEVETDPAERIYLEMDLDNITDSLSMDSDQETQQMLLTRYESILYKLYSKDDTDLAEGLSWLSDYNYQIGNYEEAIRLETEALNICKETLGTSHPDYTMSLGNLALYNSKIGNYKEAIRLETEALNI